MIGLLFSLFMALACNNEKTPPRSGAQIFASSCSSCHQSNGQGSGRLYPPLAGSEWVVGESDILIRIVMHGIKGKITVKGQTYDNIMSPWGGILSSEEMANLLTYIRSSWGNSASPISVDDVLKVKESHPNQSFWTVDTLLK